VRLTPSGSIFLRDNLPTAADHEIVFFSAISAPFGLRRWESTSGEEEDGKDRTGRQWRGGKNNIWGAGIKQREAHSEWRQHAPAAQRERHNTISHTGEACLITTRRMAMQDLPRG